MRASLVVVVAVVLALSAVAAWAYPTFPGATGIVGMPTAAVAPTGTIDAAVDYQKVSLSAITFDELGGTGTNYPIRAAAGLLDRAELSAGYAILNSDFEDLKTWNIGAKYQLMRESTGDLATVAVGADFARIQDGDHINATNLYAVASKNFAGVCSTMPFAPVAHLGLMWQDFGDPLDDSFVRPFIGVELIGKESWQGASFGLEYRFKDSDFDAQAPFSAVLRYDLQSMPLWVEIGTSNLNPAFINTGADAQKFFFGVGYRFGVTKAEESTGPGGRTRDWGY